MKHSVITTILTVTLFFLAIFSGNLSAATTVVLNVDEFVADGDWYSTSPITLDANTTNYRVEISNLSADVDLYVKTGSAPTFSSYDCRPYNGGTTSETCEDVTAGSTSLYVKVHGYQTGSFNLKVTLTTASDELDDQGSESQYHGGFNPGVGYGGFGGGNCTSTKTPVVFIHGNGDKAINWDNPPEGPYAPTSGRSVYEEFIFNGYTPCDLYGVTFLSASERENPADNYHSPGIYNILYDFIQEVLTYTGKSKVDIVAHSLGASQALATIEYHSLASSVNKFINIAGGIRGLQSCLYMGYANPWASTCGSENWFNSYIFGFYPSTGFLYNGLNRWTGSVGSKSMRRAPEFNTGITFYTITVGSNDGIHCSTMQGWADCSKGALFNSGYSNVGAQLDVGAGYEGPVLDFDFGLWSVEVAAKGGDINGLGHFRARKNTGQVIYKMLTSSCSGLDCKGTYTGPVVLEN